MTDKVGCGTQFVPFYDKGMLSELAQCQDCHSLYLIWEMEKREVDMKGPCPLCNGKVEEETGCTLTRLS